MFNRGDFNARTAEEGGRIEEVYSKRRSRDKTMNKEGEEMIEEVADCGLHIVNGDPELEEEGNFTYIGARGRSIIDYVLTEEEGRRMIERMEIGTTIESDHNPLVVTLKRKRRERKERMEAKERTIWSEEGTRKYEENIKNMKRTDTWEKLKMEVKKAMVKVKGGKKTEKREKWWDKACHERKRKLKELADKCKRGVEEAEVYRKERKEYRNWIKRKKDEEAEEMLRRLEMDRSERTFWKIVNEGRKVRVEVDSSIKEEDWRRHFMEQLEGTELEKEEEESRTEGSESEEEAVEVGIHKEEVEEAIRKLKNKKATGEDGIPNEAWKNGGRDLTERVHQVLNRIWKRKKVPKEWRTGIIRPIFKKGEKEDVKNYRGITLMDTGYKIYAEILRERLEKQLEEEEILDDTQFGFRKGRSTIDAIYMLKKAVGKEISRNKGKVFVMLADMKAAFDKIRREELWKCMEEVGIKEEITSRIKDIYEETKAVIEVEGKKVGQFKTVKGVRQGCPLSPALFNVAFAGLEKELSKAQEGGVMIGKKKVYTLAYADDITLLASNATGLREMMKRLGKFLRRRGLELNVKKSKIMMFRKGGGRKKDEKFIWEGEEIEVVKEAVYLGYKLQGNNGDTEHVKMVTKKAKATLGRIWSIGEKKFREDWIRRMRLFDTLVASIIGYGAEIWGWKERKEVEAIQDRYMKWVLKAERTTPRHVLHEETKRCSLAIRMSRRAIKYERKLVSAKEGTLKGECWDMKRKGLEETEQERNRKEFFEGRGWSTREALRRIERGEEIEVEMCQRGKDIERQERLGSLEKSRYATEVRCVIEKEERPGYLKEGRKNRKDELEIMGRFRMGCESRNSKYWLSDEERKCRLCEEEEETLEHIFERCKITKKEEKRWTEVLEGGRENLARMHQIRWIRKRKETEREKRTEEEEEGAAGEV